MRGSAALLLALPIFASCSIVAGLGDFEPADEGSGAAGAGSPASGSGAAGAQGGGGAGSSQGGAGSSQGGGGSGPGPGGGPSGGAGPGGSGGAPACNVPPCDVGAPCDDPSDCKTGVCDVDVCACNDHLVISELRSRGPSQGIDDFIELYNPTPNPIVLTKNAWTLMYRGIENVSYSNRWTSNDQEVPAYGHFLVANQGFSGPGVPNATFLQGIGDDASVKLVHQGTVIDAVCYCMLPPCLFPVADGFDCEGTGMTNPAENSSVSMERINGGASGSCIDSNDNFDDFEPIAPSDPQNLASPVTP